MSRVRDLARRAGRRKLLTCAVAAGSFAGSVAAALERSEFAFGWPIDVGNVDATAGVFDLPLALDVYRAANGIDEIAVLDRNDEAMPFYRLPEPSEDTGEVATTLDASPVYATPPGGRGTLSLETDGERTRLTLAPADRADASAAAFIVDAREVEVAPQAIELRWRATPQPFLADVVIEHSSALTAWRTVGRGPVAALEIDGAVVRNDRVALDGSTGGYYRIAIVGGPPEWRLEQARLIGRPSPTPARPATELTRIERPPTAIDDAVYFEAPAWLPIQALTLIFTGPRGWVRASVASADSLDGPWRTRAQRQLFYSVDFDGKRLESPAVETGAVTARYWQVVPIGRDPGPDMTLVVEYARERLRVNAAGAAPLTLVAGTHLTDAGPDPTLAAVWQRVATEAPAPVSAVLGPRVELGGRAALESRSEWPWRTMALWAVLAMGVAAVAAMALRLLGELRRP